MTTLDDKVVLFGGSSGSGSQNFGDTWTFDGASWTLATSAGPSPRWGAAMATLNGSVVLFGGNCFGGSSDDGYADDTWVFDGATWTLMLTSGPPARDSAAMAAINGKVVLFGGENGSAGSGFGDTWTFDGTTWTQVPTAPPADLAPAMATLGDQIVLSGYGDTWTFDGATWTQISTSGPPARQWASMAALSGGVVLFGGLGSEGGSAPDLGDTWSFGGTWTQASSSGPPARAMAAMATLP